jgi:hypothetical protein
VTSCWERAGTPLRATSMGEGRRHDLDSGKLSKRLPRRNVRRPLPSPDVRRDAFEQAGRLDDLGELPAPPSALSYSSVVRISGYMSSHVSSGLR